jgi:hypothetical protein
MSLPVAGLACRIRIPVRHYEAVALCVAPGRAGGAHVIRLMHRDPGLSLDVEAFGSYATAEAYRDRLADFLGLPELVVAGTPAGDGGNASAPRRVRAAQDRRPRFLTRRRTGAVTVRRVEGSEIIARH